ncbi:unnamed protein product [Acanthoscelides obtectus]|uniref:Uncharacterized protein n=1 Tax=Acanthoscelides obtectus TaxID=200917 RepID=A0A9P0KIX6_ACAOB|nr:unnamed protein product [Acanthoscelides obtectus]CAK1633073.1 Transposable element Tc1 transposase [Acanthoscelides obtectus]
MFSDETRFNLHHSDGRVLVWRQAGERYDEENTGPQEAFGGGCITVWAGVVNNGKTELFISNRIVDAAVHRDNILNNIVVPFAQDGGGEDFVIIDDKTRPHRALTGINFLAKDRYITASAIKVSRLKHN